MENEDNNIMDPSNLNLIFDETSEEFKDEFEAKKLFKQNQALFHQADVFLNQCKILEVKEKAIDEMMEVETAALEQLKDDKKLVHEELIEALAEDREANIWKFVGEDNAENTKHEKYKANLQRDQLMEVEETVVVLQGVKRKIRKCATLELCKFEDMQTQMDRLKKKLVTKMALKKELEQKAVDQSVNFDQKMLKLQQEIDEIDARSTKLETCDEANAHNANLLHEISELKVQMESELEKQQEASKLKLQQEQKLKLQEEQKLKEELELKEELKLQQEQALLQQKQKEAEEAAAKIAAQQEEIDKSDISLSDTSMTSDKSVEEDVPIDTSNDAILFKHPKDFFGLLLPGRGGNKTKKNLGIKFQPSTSAGSSSIKNDRILPSKIKKNVMSTRLSRSLFIPTPGSAPKTTREYPKNVTLGSEVPLQKRPRLREDAIALRKRFAPKSAKSQEKLADVDAVPSKVLPISNENMSPEEERGNSEMSNIDSELTFEKFALEVETPKLLATIVPVPQETIEAPVVAQVVKSKTDIAAVSTNIHEPASPASINEDVQDSLMAEPQDSLMAEPQDSLMAEPQALDDQDMEIVLVEDDIFMASENNISHEQQGPVEVNATENENMTTKQQDPEADVLFEGLNESINIDNYDDLFKDDTSNSSIISNTSKMPSFEFDEADDANMFPDPSFPSFEGDMSNNGDGFF